MKKIKILLLLLILNSCSLFKEKREEKKPESLDLRSLSKITQVDYKEHLESLKHDYLKTKGIKKISLSRKSRKYLSSVVAEIQKNNELFFTKKSKVNFSIIKNESPFHFSLPEKNIFISTGLLNKYIKSEKLLYCLIIHELIRSEKSVYRKQILIPTGFLTTKKVLSMMRLKIEDKVEIHKWAFYLLKRIGINTDNYLSWLQIQNRNSIDFSMQLGDISVISREEALFKAFIIKNTDTKSNKYHAGSSRSFYSFVNDIKR
jgi:hypothetical protein